MAVRRCDQCGAEEYMPFVCKFCKGRYCSAHRLPENHGCVGLTEYQERARSEGRLMRPEPDVVTPRMDHRARAGAILDRFFTRVQGKMAYVLLGTIVGVFLLQNILHAFAPGPKGAAVTADVYNFFIFVLAPDFYLRPWTIFTSMLAHGSFHHLLANGIVLFFFGPTLESLIGTRRFTWLFLGAGVVAGLAQVIVFQTFVPMVMPDLNVGRGVIGASGAIMGLLGCLTILAPRLTVLLFFIVPVQLWIITIGYAALDFLLLFDQGGVARLAHLAGLAIGLAYGRHLHSQGLRARIRQPSPGQSRRPF